MPFEDRSSEIAYQLREVPTILVAQGLSETDAGEVATILADCRRLELV